MRRIRFTIHFEKHSSLPRIEFRICYFSRIFHLLRCRAHRQYLHTSPRHFSSFPFHIRCALAFFHFSVQFSWHSVEWIQLIMWLCLSFRLSCFFDLPHTRRTVSYAKCHVFFFSSSFLSFRFTCDATRRIHAWAHKFSIFGILMNRRLFKCSLLILFFNKIDENDQNWKYLTKSK